MRRLARAGTARGGRWLTQSIATACPCHGDAAGSWDNKESASAPSTARSKGTLVTGALQAKGWRLADGRWRGERFGAVPGVAVGSVFGAAFHADPECGREVLVAVVVLVCSARAR